MPNIINSDDVNFLAALSEQMMKFAEEYEGLTPVELTQEQIMCEIRVIYLRLRLNNPQFFDFLKFTEKKKQSTVV